MTTLKKLRTLTRRLVAGAVTLTSMVALISLVLTAAGPAAQAQTLSVIHTFTGGGDGSTPKAGVTLRAGSIFGTATAGGNGNGTAWQAMPLGNSWFTVPISIFSGGGKTPLSRLVFGPDGHPYGTTYQAGTRNAGIFYDLIVPVSLCKTASCYWKENVLYNFQAAFSDGTNPGYGDPIWDQAGNVYGTTISGGASNNGAVYKLTKSGNTWTDTLLYSFAGGSDGRNPQNGVVFNSSGDLFGTTQQGGTSAFGSVFQLKFVVGIGWIESLAYNFKNTTDGKYPNGGLVVDSAGNLYGSTSDGGSGGGGTVFELSPSGDSWNYTLLYSFTGTLNQKCGPGASLTMDASGSLYGTTYCDGANKLGSVFKLTKAGNVWNYTPLHDFTGMNDGSNPVSDVTFDASGNMYGTASAGGAQKAGTVWMITPQ